MRVLKGKYFKMMLVAGFIYITVMMSGLEIKKMIDLPTFLFLVVGTVLVTFFYYKKGMPAVLLLDKAKRNCLIVGALGLLIGIMALLTGTVKVEQLLPNIAISLLMIPYTAVFYLGMHIYQSHLIGADSCESIAAASDGNLIGKYDLSEREKEIVDALFEGMSNKEIADRFFITESTVKKHISNIYRKIGVKSRHELVCLFRGSTT